MELLEGTGKFSDSQAATRKALEGETVPPLEGRRNLGSRGCSDLGTSRQRRY